MLTEIKKDLQAAYDHDAAARNKLEIILTYSGFHALFWYRIAHIFHTHRFFFTARVISQITKFFTGVEIHPGAQIGTGVFIDHGMGVVIGETSVIGNNVVMYQGVTLGGTGKDKGKRHPTIEDNVMISAGAKILGPFTVGKNSKIGAGSIVLKEVPPSSTVVGVPGRVVKIEGKRIDDLDQNLPDPTANDIAAIKKQLGEIYDMLGALKSKGDKGDDNA